MHPIIIQSIATERSNDRQQTARHNRDAKLARGRRLRQHQEASQTSGTVHLLPARLRLHTS
jgi:hypothetical protein